MSSANATCCKKIDYKETYFELKSAIVNLKYDDLYNQKDRNINPIIALEINAQIKILEHIIDEIIPNRIVYEKEQ